MIYLGFFFALMADGISKWVAFRYLPHMFNLNIPQTPIGIVIYTAVIWGIMWQLWSMSKDERLAPVRVSVGAMLGAATGNYISVFTGPEGVIDFIPMGHIVANVADLFIWAGALINVGYVIWLIARPRLVGYMRGR